MQVQMCFSFLKNHCFFKQASTTSLLIYDQSGIATTIATTGADAVNKDGTTLATAVEQIDYIINNND